MTGSLAVLGALALAAPPANLDDAERELSEAIHASELKAHVYRLASPEFLGRRGPGAARTARHLVAALERLGLKPAFGDSYEQPIPSPAKDGKGGESGFLGRNVGGLIPGSDPGIKDEWVLLAAHYDHLGKKGEQLYPGADDNASGVAMLLEVAERFALRKERPRRTLAFVAFDREEDGLLGSKHFAARPPLPLGKLRAMLCADMLGRSMANVMDEYLFVLGSEHSDRLRQIVAAVRPEKGLTVGRLGADLIGTRSDYGPFRDRQVPFLFFSTGQHPDYHRPTDLPDRIDYEKLRRVSVYISDLLARLADDDESPAWRREALPPDLDEIRTVRAVVRRVLDHPTEYPLTGKQRELVGGVDDRLAGILKRGDVTEEDRNWLFLTAQFLMRAVF
jgi:hypothetical protein